MAGVKVSSNNSLQKSTDSLDTETEVRPPHFTTGLSSNQITSCSILFVSLRLIDAKRTLTNYYGAMERKSFP